MVCGTENGTHAFNISSKIPNDSLFNDVTWLPIRLELKEQLI